MAKLTLTVNDDAGQHDNNSVDLTATTYLVGDSSTQYQLVGFRFVNATVPQGAAIRRAVIRLYFSTISTSGINAPRVAAEDADNSAVFTTDASSISSRTLTSQEPYSYSRIHDNPANNYYEFDVTTSVQTVINRVGWSSGNALTIVINRGTNTSEYTVHTKENTGSDDPQLSIVYDDSATAELTSGAEENVDAAWTNISNIRADDGSNATGADMSTTEAFTAKDFGITGPSGSDTIDDIAVKVQMQSSSLTSKERMGVELSWDGGTSWATAKYTKQLSNAAVENHYISGGPAGWSHTFTASELSNTNFRARVTPDSGTVFTDYTIDVITIQVYYTVVAGGTTVKDIISEGLLFPR